MIEGGQTGSDELGQALDAQFLAYALILNRHINVFRATQQEGDRGQPMFSRYLQGDYRRHQSFNRAGLVEPDVTTYNRLDPAPPVTELMAHAHTLFRANTMRLPRLDEDSLDPKTQAVIELLKGKSGIIQEYQALVAATGADGVRPSSDNIPAKNQALLILKSEQIMHDLYRSELTTADYIPLKITSKDGEASTVIVENKNNLGLYLLALSVAAQFVLDKDRLPEGVSEFVRAQTAVAKELAQREVRRLHTEAADPVRDATEGQMRDINARMEALFVREQRALQMAALCATSQSVENYVKNSYQKTLRELQLPLLPEQLESPLEMGLVMESLSANLPITSLDNMRVRGDYHRLAERYEQCHLFRTYPSEELLAATEAAFAVAAEYGTRDNNNKLSLAKQYVAMQRQQQEEASSVSKATQVRGKGSQQTP